jgi:ribosome-associated toxin RatA of RatAB toxin-antitoxin module
MSELTIEEVKRGRINGVRATFHVDFSYEHVADTMWDLERFARIFPDILELKMIREAPGEQEVLYRIDAVYKELSYVLRRVRQDNASSIEISWKMVKGDLRDIIGSWTLHEHGEGQCRVVYESFVDASVLVPTSVIRKVAKAKLNEMVGRVHQACKSA